MMLPVQSQMPDMYVLSTQTEKAAFWKSVVSGFGSETNVGTE